MGFFDFLKRPDINQGVAAYRATPGAILLDVRTPQEFQAGRIPGSKSLPLQELGQVGEIAREKGTPLFVYCLSGARSRRAAGLLRQMGYACVTDIGGISAYAGALEH